MINLAGDKNCDTHIRHELTEAGIQLVNHEQPLKQEVPQSVTGQLVKDGKVVFTFTRAWYYWMVGGSVPIDIAREMYADPVGKKDVRVAGHCGCPPPDEWADPNYDELHRRGLLRSGMSILECIEISVRENVPMTAGGYHIDSQAGLNLFVATIKKYNLID